MKDVRAEGQVRIKTRGMKKDIVIVKLHMVVLSSCFCQH